MAFFLEPKAAGPVVPTMWETIGPTQVQYNPDEYIQRAYGWPSDHRGQRFYQPLPYGADPTAPPVAHPMSQYVGMILLLLGVGVLAYYLGRSGARGVSKNPGTIEENPCSCPSHWLPAARRPRRAGLSKNEHKRRRRRACGQPRDAQGRFA